jgi:hypothetical protein
MKFAFTLVAGALINQRDQSKHTVEQFLSDAFTFLNDAVRHSIKAVAAVTINEVWPRFT